MKKSIHGCHLHGIKINKKNGMDTVICPVSAMMVIIPMVILF